MKKVKIPKNIPIKKIHDFFKKKGLTKLIKLSTNETSDVNTLIEKNPYQPDLKDLYRLYQFVYLNKRTTILEFGSGWSSLVLSLALNDLKKIFSHDVKKLRRNNPFEIFILENERKFLNITKKRFLKFKKIEIKKNYFFSEVNMTTYAGKFSTEYHNLPLCNPDFIYLDGPDQFNIKKKVNNFTTGHKDMMPMVSDILKMEYFLTPGTIIVSDGRSANCKFLKDHFKRKWLHKHDLENDQHIFYLDDPCLGKYNRMQLEFYKRK